MTDNGSLLTDRTVKSRTVDEFASGKVQAYKSTLISAGDSVYNFIVKQFSPSVCVAVVSSLAGNMAAQSFAYHAHGTADNDKSCCYPWFACHDKK